MKKYKNPPTWQPFLQQQQLAVAIRDKTTSTNQMAISSAGALTASIIGNGTPPSRTMNYWTVTSFPFAAATETLLTVTESVAGAASGTFTTRVVASGKTMRITNILVSVENGGSTPIVSRVYVNLRFNTAGAVTNASQLVYRIGCGVPQSTTTKTMTTVMAVIPDGLEFLGDGTKQIGISAICPEWVTTTQIPSVSISCVAYEY